MVNRSTRPEDLKEAEAYAAFKAGYLTEIDLTKVIEHFPSAMIITDDSGFPVSYNQKVVDILGTVPVKIPPEDWPVKYGLYLADNNVHYPVENLPLVKALKGKEANSADIFLFNNHHSNGKWISMSARPITTEDGRISGTFVFLNDVTSRKQITDLFQSKIRWAEASYSLSQQIANIGNDPKQILNMVVDFASNIIGDGCVAALLNIPEDRLKVIAVHHTKPAARELLLKTIHSQEFGLQGAIESVIRSGKPLLVPVVDQALLEKSVRPDQLDYLHEVGVNSLLVVPIKGRTGVLGTLSLVRDRGGSPYTSEDQSFILDVGYRIGLAINNEALLHSLRRESSGRWIAEKALALSEARFRSIFTSTALGIKLLDLEATILETNPAFQNMVGYSEEELNGLPLYSLLHPADKAPLRGIIDKLRDGRLQTYQYEHRLLNKNGQIVWVNASFASIKNGSGETPAFVVGIAEDITIRKRIQAEMTEMKSRLDSSIEMERLHLAQELHDGPLQDLYSAVYKIENWEDHLNQDGREKNELLKQDLLKVIQGLRDTAKNLRPPALTNFGLEKAIRSHAEEFIEQHPELTIHLQLTEDKQDLPENIRLILFRIYQNSLANILRHAQATEVFVNFAYDAEESQLSIRDNGVGFVVPGTWVELVRQGHYGLAGAVERVELLSGKFWVESIQGGGTTVHVVIPNKEISILNQDLESEG